MFGCNNNHPKSVHSETMVKRTVRKAGRKLHVLTYIAAACFVSVFMNLIVERYFLSYASEAGILWPR